MFYFQMLYYYQTMYFA